MDEAIACYNKAIALDPKYAAPHGNLGNVFFHKGQWDEAIACYKKAIALDPKNARTHSNLGAALYRKGQFDEAIVSCKKAIELEPKNAGAHSGLGWALYGKGQWDEAILCFQKALELNPKDANARNALTKTQRLATAQGKLAASLKGEFQPSTNDERLGLAELCHSKKRYRSAAGLYADAFAADPKLADNLTAGHRYNAACHAALAAAGQGEDAAKLDDTERARLRKQALDWLRADLTLRTKQLASGQPSDRAQVQWAMKHWQQDSDLAGIREAKDLAKLPVDERQACEKLWADVAALLKKTER